MSEESRFMEFFIIGNTGKTEIWDVVSKSSESVLGKIKWYGPWRQYCFYPSPNCIFNNQCMTDIQKKISKLMNERR